MQKSPCGPGGPIWIGGSHKKNPMRIPAQVSYLSELGFELCTSFETFHLLLYYLQILQKDTLASLLVCCVF